MYLITGGAGFIGSHLVDHLLGRGDEVVCLDDFNNFYDPEVKRKNIERHRNYNSFHLVEGDIRDEQLLSSVFGRFELRKVVHLAARAGVRPSVEQPLLYEDVNVGGTIRLLEQARLKDIQQFVFASSSSVYGGNTKIPFHEDDRIIRTVSPYAATKYAGELMCYTYHHLYGIPTTCLRFFTVYGPRQRPEMAIHKFTRLIYDRKPVPMLGDGKSGRDYTYVSDIIQGIIAAVDRPFDFEIFNLGESYCVSLNELINLLREVTGKTVEIQEFPVQKGDVPVTYAEISKARQLLGYRPHVSLRNGLAEFVKWFEMNSGS